MRASRGALGVALAFCVSIGGAGAQPAFTDPSACLAEAGGAKVADPARRAGLAACMLKSRSYRDAVRTLEGSGYVVNSTVSKQIELAESSGQRERAGQMLERLLLGR